MRCSNLNICTNLNRNGAVLPCHRLFKSEHFGRNRGVREGVRGRAHAPCTLESGTPGGVRAGRGGCVYTPTVRARLRRHAVLWNFEQILKLGARTPLGVVLYKFEQGDF